MIHDPSWIAIFIFFTFVGITLGISFLAAGKSKSSQGYFAAHGEIHWFVNGIAFAGDYLSAASFLGICGMIAFFGYDGFLYSIGYLAGWIVALFLIAEPIKKLGKFTFADALDAKFNSRGIRLVAGISTLAVSVFYLIPQMVGAGVLIQPLLGFSHEIGVIVVGTVVIVIVTTAGMVSTTYVQFLKGSLLVLFSLILVIMILDKGLSTDPSPGKGHPIRVLGPFTLEDFQQGRLKIDQTQWEILPLEKGLVDKSLVGLKEPGGAQATYWRREKDNVTEGKYLLLETQTILTPAKSGETALVNGKPKGAGPGEGRIWGVGNLWKLPESSSQTGPLNPVQFLTTVQNSEILLWSSEKIKQPDGAVLTIFYPKVTPGKEILSPGNHPSLKGIRSEKFSDKLNFISLMLALFCGTASLPHILIRYYTVKSPQCARKSTVTGIASIGFFYILTLFLGLGAMVSGALDPGDNNMSAPLLAKTFGEFMFAIISAIAFTTVLGTVSGLIVAASGAVVHDLMSGVLGHEMEDHAKVKAGKVAAVGVGILAIILGILFQKMNVNYLVGWAFSIAASANLPSLIMLLFWKGTTRQGIIAAVLVGMVSSLAWILLSSDTFKDVYGVSPEKSLAPFSQPGIVTIPLGFITLVAVSLLTGKKKRAA